MKERIIEFLRKNVKPGRIKTFVSDIKKKIPGKAKTVPVKKRRGRITKAKRRQKVKRQLLMCGLFIIVCIALIITYNTKASERKKSEEAVKTEQKKEKEKVPDNVAEKMSESEIDTVSESETLKQKVKRIRKEATEKGYPEDIINLLKKNNETVTFVENYEEKKDLPIAEKVSDTIEDGEIPQLLQWDERWGYAPYGSGFVATCGCGPTCMSMVVSGLTKDVSVTPAVVAAYSDKKGYIDEENNTYWTLMQEGGEHWGVSCYEGSVDEQSVKAELKAGHPIICSVGPGDFTKNGHFIVLTKYSKGKVRVNDPFSQKNSEKLWVYEDIKDQIKALWVYSVDE
ncbi:MAG: C39 family peptidase [Lachnospiraceae bacterium]